MSKKYPKNEYASSWEMFCIRLSFWLEGTTMKKAFAEGRAEIEEEIEKAGGELPIETISFDD